MKHKNASNLSGVVVGGGKTSVLSHISARLPFSRRKKLILFVLVLVIAAAGGGAYYYFYIRKPKPVKAPVVLTPLSKITYKPTEFTKTIVSIGDLFEASKPTEAIAATRAALAKTSDAKEKEALYLQAGSGCQAFKNYGCVAEFYGKLDHTHLDVARLFQLAEAYEQTGKKAEALTTFKYIHDNKATLYGSLETAADIDKRVTDAITRLGS